MTRVITISREWGAGGETVARLLADRLDWRLVDDFLIDQIAKSAKVDRSVAQQFDERVNSWFHQLMKSVWVGGFETAASRVEYPVFDSDSMAALWERVIKDAAALGNCVIVGRAAQCILRKHSDVFHVSLYAPVKDKIERMRTRTLDASDVAALSEEMDQQRRAYIRHYFNEDWKNPQLYHLSINTHIGLPTVVEVILAASGLSAVKKGA